MHAMAATEERRKVLDPHSKLAGRNTRRIVARVVQDAEDSVGKKLSHRSCHACEAHHEKVDRIATV